jgi:hypothetical protein
VKSLQILFYSKYLKIEKFCSGLYRLQFKVSSINFKASSYTNLIDWTTDIFTEPPLIINMSVEELTKFVEGVEDHEIFKYPYHTQGTERCIRFASIAASSVTATKKDMA